MGFFLKTRSHGGQEELFRVEKMLPTSSPRWPIPCHFNTHPLLSPQSPNTPTSSSRLTTMVHVSRWCRRCFVYALSLNSGGNGRAEHDLTHPRGSLYRFLA